MRLIDREITGLTADSRAVRHGYLFAALPGAKADGRAFITDAIARGATAILAPPGTAVPTGTLLIADDNPRRRFSLLAAEFYGAQPATIAAVTGTNGKTSTAEFTRQIWAALGHQSASLGTLGVRAPGREDYGALTTPDAVTLHATLAELAHDGITNAAIEASSHGLDQHRLDGVKISAAGFTNLTRDHLDYHATMDDYLAAKLRLFEHLLPATGTAVANADIPEFSAIEKICKSRSIALWYYGANGDDLKILSRTPVAGGQDITLRVFGREHRLTLPLVGAFMAMNALCALGLALSDNADLADKAVEALKSLKGAPGRLQSVPGHPSGAAIYVDYAHTPDALENALKALRPHTVGRLVCIFGCGGDRDPGKRPIMGAIAAKLSDLAIVTDDNPRTEEASQIRAAILAAAPGAREISDRRKAIATSIHELKAGDTLVICGKGHERGQTIGTSVEPFDDVEEATNAIANL